MLVSLWNYLRGYVIIEVRGASAVRFLNIASRNGIYIWDVCEAPGSTIRMKVSVKAFWGLRAYSRKAGCKLRIVGRMGFPFVANRYRSRRFLVLGALGFVTVLYALSLFVWQVEIIGANRLSPADISQTLSEAGLSPGVLRMRVPARELERMLLSQFDDIAWAGIQLRGTRAIISLTETLPRQVLVERNSPSNIIASHDALIVSMVTLAGTPIARVDDVVRQGDILVSAEVVIRDDETGRLVHYVHSDAQILGKRYYNINFNIPYEYIVHNYTGNERRSYDIIILGHSFTPPLPPHGFALYTLTTSLHTLALSPDHPLPITLATHTYRELIEAHHQRDTDQAKHLAEILINSHIITKLDINADIVDRQTHFLEYSPSELWVRTVITTIEDIGLPSLVVQQSFP